MKKEETIVSGRARQSETVRERERRESKVNVTYKGIECTIILTLNQVFIYP